MGHLLLAALFLATALFGADSEALPIQLAGQKHYMSGDYKKATQAFQAAVAAQPSNSDHYLWLGRAFGRRAEQSSPFTAPVYAGKARQNFERAVELNPRNIEALNDLFEYYKAALLMKRIAELDPVEAHYARYRLAEKKGDTVLAERELRYAAAMAPEQAGRAIDLARFLAKQGRYAESEQFFQSAERVSPNQPKLLFERADTYIRARRNLEAAREMLKRYLAAELNPDDPPRHEAEKLLRQASRS